MEKERQLYRLSRFQYLYGRFQRVLCVCHHRFLWLQRKLIGYYRYCKCFPTCYHYSGGCYHILPGKHSKPECQYGNRFNLPVETGRNQYFWSYIQLAQFCFSSRILCSGCNKKQLRYIFITCRCHGECPPTCRKTYHSRIGVALWFSCLFSVSILENHRKEDYVFDFKPDTYKLH
jgi:hypothetical protein